MHDPIGRRDFLKKNMAAGLLLGFPFLEGCAQEKPSSPAKKPAHLELALERMRTGLMPGVVIVVPEQPERAEQLANELSYLVGATDAMRKAAVLPVRIKGFVPDPVSDGDPLAHRLFCQAVFVCVNAKDARLAFPDLKADTAALLLDPSGKLVDQLAVTPTLFSKDFGERMGHFVHGAKGERLTAAAAAQRSTLGVEFCGRFDKAVRDLCSDTFEVRETASRQLADTSQHAPLLMAKAMNDSTDLEARYRLMIAFDGLYAAAPQEKSGPRLPFGTSWQQVQFDPCPGCGRVAMPAASRAFLRFAAEKPK